MAGVKQPVLFKRKEKVLLTLDFDKLSIYVSFLSEPLK